MAKVFYLYAFDYYVKLQADLKEKANNELDPVKQKQIRNLRDVYAARLVQARKAYKQKMALIESGILGPMPEVFPDGREVSYCPICHRRVETADMLTIVKKEWTWLDKCQRCRFEATSEKISKSRTRAKTIMPPEKERLCPMCGVVKPIEQFYVRGYVLVDGETVPRRYPVCGPCSNQDKKVADHSNVGTPKPLPYVFYDEGKKIAINKEFFLNPEDKFDGSTLAQVGDLVRDLNMDESVLNVIKDAIKDGTLIKKERMKYVPSAQEDKS